jgi:cysteine rich repeat protein
MTGVNVFSGVYMRWMAVLAGVACLSMAAGVSAEPTARPCAEDAARLCQGVQHGQGRIAQCLKEHTNELSPACRKNMEEMKKKIHDFVQACKEDKKKLCNDVKPGGGRILQCLKQHEGELSPACKEKMEQPKGR